ncbi:hypothetical protein [Peribacillus sp. NPDC097895]
MDDSYFNFYLTAVKFGILDIELVPDKYRETLRNELFPHPNEE